MPSQMAAILNSYRASMPEAGSGMRAGVESYLAGKERQRIAKAEAEELRQENRLQESAEGRAKTKEKREQEKHEREGEIYQREKRLATMKQWLGPISQADTADKWAAAQTSGFVPKGLKFKDRESFIMAAMTEDERLNRAKQATAEKEHTRKVAKDRTEGGGGRTELKATDERYISSRVAGLFDGIYDIRTGSIQIADDKNRRLAQKIIADASRLAANNPNMTLSGAVSEAAGRNGIDVRELEAAGQPAAPAAGGGSDPLGLRGAP